MTKLDVHPCITSTGDFDAAWDAAHTKQSLVGTEIFVARYVEWDRNLYYRVIETLIPKRRGYLSRTLGQFGLMERNDIGDLSRGFILD